MRGSKAHPDGAKEHQTMSKTKCIVRQGWTTRDADGNLIERRDYVYVTNEDGTPHVYASIAEARADIRGNYGRDANRAGILHTRSVDDYTGHVHDGYVYIVREDTDEFVAATADAKAEQDERAAVEAIAADMLEEYGNAEDATNATAYGVFTDMHDGARPNDLEPADMEQMDRLMTYAAEAIASIQQTAEQAAYEARNAATVNAGKATKELESLTVCLGDGDAEEAETCANWCETAAEAAEDAARIAAEHARKAGTEAAQEAAETAAEHACRARRLSSIARDAIRYQWTAEETRENIAYYAAIRTAIAATRAFLAAYADAIGETVNDDDPEARAAYHVARDEMTSASIRATAADRETVAAMVEAIARDARRTHTGDPLAKYRSVEYLELDAPRPTYQRAELLDYLGEPDDYDVTAIEHEATAYDPATGRTVWAVDADTLAAIAERHQLQFYAPAF